MPGPLRSRFFYAVVHDWNGRCGIYNLEKHENITELEYRQLNFSRIMNLEGGNQATVFYGKKGVREGAVAVDPDFLNSFIIFSWRIFCITP